MRSILYLSSVALGLVACSEQASETDAGDGGASTSESGAGASQGSGGAGQGPGGAASGGGMPACSDHLLDCDADGVCETDILLDAANCGGCGHACDPGPNGAPACIEASCGFDCLDGHADCNGIHSDGCETDPQTSVWNCGGCGVMCPTHSNATPSCVAGSCVDTCDGGYADCNGDPTDGCEVALAYHPANCGACGTVCPAENGTAQCSAGHCIVELASGLGDVRDIEVQGGYVYVSAAGIRRVPVSGGAATFLGSAGSGFSEFLALGGSSVYFLHDGFGSRGLFSLPQSGGPVTQVAALNPNPSWPARDLVVDTTTAYWIEGFALTTVPLTGGTPTTWGVLSAKGGPGLASGNVYWTAGSNHGDVYGMPLGGGPVTTVFDGFGPYDLLETAGGYAYIATSSALERVPLSGGSAQLLASGLDPTYYMATDGVHVYLYANTSTGGALVRVPAIGGNPEVRAILSSASLNEGGVALDSTHIYWADQGTIRKMPK